MQSMLKTIKTSDDPEISTKMADTFNLSEIVNELNRFNQSPALDLKDIAINVEAMFRLGGLGVLCTHPSFLDNAGREMFKTYINTLAQDKTLLAVLGFVMKYTISLYRAEELAMKASEEQVWTVSPETLPQEYPATPDPLPPQPSGLPEEA